MAKEAKLTIRLEADLRERLETLADAEQRTLSAFVVIKLRELAPKTKTAPAGHAGAAKGKRKSG